MRIILCMCRVMFVVFGVFMVGVMFVVCGFGMLGELVDGGGGEDGVMIVQFWYCSFMLVENEWYVDIVKKFNVLQDEIKVVDIEVFVDVWDQKMKVVQVVGKVFDFYMSFVNFYDFVNVGQVYEFDLIVLKEVFDEIFDIVIFILVIDGIYYVYLLFFELQIVLFWNIDMFDVVGVDFLVVFEIWDDFFVVCVKIQFIFVDGQYCIFLVQDVVMMVWLMVGQQYNFVGYFVFIDDWMVFDIDNDGYWDFMVQYKELWDKGYMFKQLFFVYVGGEDFGQQKVVFKVFGLWMMFEIGFDYVDLFVKIGVGVFLSLFDVDGCIVMMMGNFMWVVDVKSKVLEVVGKFLFWVIVGDFENFVFFFVDMQFIKVFVCQVVQDVVVESEEVVNVLWLSIIVDDIVLDVIFGFIYLWDVNFVVGIVMELVMKGLVFVDDVIKIVSVVIQMVIECDGLLEKVLKN